MRKTKVHPLLKKVMESAEEKKRDAGWTGKVRKKLASLPPRIWTFGGAVILILAIGWCMFLPDQKEAPRTPPKPGAAGTAVTPGGQSPASAVTPAGIPESELVFIQSVRLQPLQPTPMDSLKADIVLAPTAPERLAYTYQWKVNDQAIKEATGETLNLSPFKKGDLITVTVTPRVGDTYGHAVESPLVSVHSAPPTLELKAA
ncbi:MAG: hypothetical protein JXL20_00190, partial [Deltaproteobacteria bacterium]|nr:hypothetical protein [Deltaproteobacteria bacterium]